VRTACTGVQALWCTLNEDVFELQLIIITVVALAGGERHLSCSARRSCTLRGYFHS
jgi:hypothetical protein